MKILILTAAMDSGGAETHIFSLSQGLSALGIDVTVASSGGLLVRKLEEVGIRHITLLFDKNSPLNILRTRKKLRRMLRYEHFDLIHAHARIAAFIAAPIAEKYGVPFITTVHAYFCLSPIYRYASKWGQHTIAVSEDLRQYLCAGYGISPENTTVIPNGIDTSVFMPRRESRKGYRIVFISRLDSDCSAAALSLCNIGERILSSFPSAEILICGGGDMLSAIQKKANAVCASVEKQFISILGHVENTAELLQSADVFVGVSRAALEALGCGAVTVLCGNEGSLGLIKDKHDLELAELSNFCCRGMSLFTDEELFSEISRALSLSEQQKIGLSKLYTAYISERHSVKMMSEMTLDVYRKIIKQLNKNGNKNILLGGYYGFGNMGDNALLRASILRAKAAYGKVNITALTKRPRKDSQTFGIPCVGRMNLFSVAKQLCKTDIFVLGGGTLLQDRTSLRSLAYYSSLCLAAKLFGARVELWGNGLTSPHTAIASRLVRSSLSASDHIGLRDIASVTEALRIISPEEGDRLYYERDLALSQDPSVPSRIGYLHKLYGIDPENKKEYAVVAVKGSSGRGYLDIFERCLSDLANDGIRLIFLPMFPKEDLALSRRLCKSLGGAVAEGISESDAVGLMKNACIVCGMRLHALVFASAAQTPFVGFGADPKIESFCREQGGLYLTDMLQ